MFTASTNHCPSLYQSTFSDPLLIERAILAIYSLILIIGLVGNIMTLIIIKSNAHLRTPTNYYLLNLAVSDLLMLMCNLPLEMIEISHREWPLSIALCKLRNISAEFFTCSSILTILAFTCERYVAIVHPMHFHRLSQFRRAQNGIFIIWFTSLAFSLPLGLSYEIETNVGCKSCVTKKSAEKLLAVIVIITAIALFFLPMCIIGAIYLLIGQALRRLSKYEISSHSIELSSSTRSSLSYRGTLEMQPAQSSHMTSYTWLKLRARCQARQVVVKTLVTVVIAFFLCYAPLYLQRLLLAIVTLNSSSPIESAVWSTHMAYLYVLSGVTFYFGSAINPILFNVVSNKYRRAFVNLCHCRSKHQTPFSENHRRQVLHTDRQKVVAEQQQQRQDKLANSKNRRTTLNLNSKRLVSTNSSPL